MNIPRGDFIGFTIDGIHSSRLGIIRVSESSRLTENLLLAFSYKTGGLVTDTGLAWLDGTRANPEYVLNADITKLMFEALGRLQDVQSARKQISNSILSKTQNLGDMNVEININVDKIDSDYDISQLAQQIKEELVTESMYRNVNTISFLR